MNKNLDYFEAFVWPFCEKDCLFCNEWWYGKRKFHSLEEFKKIIDKNNFSKVVLTWWEPMTNPKLDEYISYCKNKNIIISLVTAIDSKNYLQKIEQYIHAGLNEIMISLEWPEKIHDALIQKKWAYKQIIETLYYLNTLNNSQIKVIIHSNINAVNYKYLVSFIKHILNNFPCIFNYHLQMLEPFGSAYQNKKILFKSYSELIEPIFKNIDTIQSKHKIKFWRLPLCLVWKNNQSYISQTPQIFEEHNNQTELAGYEWTKYQSNICKKCSKYKICDGFFDYYIKEYWTKEIIPFT